MSSMSWDQTIKELNNCYMHNEPLSTNNYIATGMTTFICKSSFINTGRAELNS